MISVSLTESATRLLGEQGINLRALDWHISDKPDAFVICGAEELTRTVTAGARAVLLLSRRDDITPLPVDRITVPFEVAFLPVTHVELKQRSRYLTKRMADGARNGPSTEPTDEEMGTHRLALAGRVSAGMAHEMRNALSYTRANTNYMLEAIEAGRFTDPELKAVAEEALDGITRALEASQTVLSLSRGVKREPKSIDLNNAVKKAAKLVKLELQSQIRLDLELIELPNALADLGPLIQVLTNLILNAVDAVGPSGRVVVRTLKLDDRVGVSVADNGPGIAEEIASRLFQPFTSGKPDRGTGLGLAISRSIIESLGGTIEYMTGSLGGAEFRILLPTA